MYFIPEGSRHWAAGCVCCVWWEQELVHWRQHLQKFLWKIPGRWNVMTPSFMSQTSWVVSRSTLFVHQFFIPMAEVWLYQEAERELESTHLLVSSSPGIWWWNYWGDKEIFYSRRSVLVILRHPVGSLASNVCVCVCACVFVGAWAHVHEHMLWMQRTGWRVGWVREEALVRGVWRICDWVQGEQSLCPGQKQRKCGI